MNNPFHTKAAGTAVAFALAAFAGSAGAGVPGYVTNVQDQVWTTPYGLCWRTTSWSPQTAVPPCDSVPRVEAPVPVVAVVTPAPEPVAKPEPTPLVVVPPPPPPVIERVSLSSDVLFEFDKAQLRPQGREELDKLADRLKDAQVDSVLAIGYADPIGNEKYNKELSTARADAVKEHLSQRGIERSRINIEGRGETQEFTQGQCKGMSGSKLISCFEPNRRVDIEVRGTRQVAGTGAPSAGAGATGAAAGGSSAAGTSGAPK